MLSQRDNGNGAAILPAVWPDKSSWMSAERVILPGNFTQITAEPPSLGTPGTKLCCWPNN